MHPSDIDRRTAAIAAAAILAIAGAVLALTGGQQPGTADDPGAAAGNWTHIQLTDVRTNESFTVAQFDRPVLVETFAVWCPTCTRQQQAVKTLHGQVGDDIVSISLDIDPNEDAAKVRDHVQRHGFDWRYAVAPPRMSQALARAFGQSVLVAPRAPMILVCPDDTATRLPDGVKTADTLQTAVQDRC